MSTPLIFIHGIFGWGDKNNASNSGREGPPLGMPKYWPEIIHSWNGPVWCVNVGACSSDHDRACEVFYQLKGGVVDYGAEHSRKCDHGRYSITNYTNPLYPIWDEDHPVHLIGHSYGGTTSLELYQLLCTDFFEVGSSHKWVKSITAIASPLSGATLAYIFGMRHPDLEVPKWSVSHFLGIFFGSLYLMIIRFPIMRRLYDFRMEQWEQTRSNNFWNLITQDHPFLISQDNCLHGSVPAKRLERNDRLVDMDKTYLFTVTLSRHPPGTRLMASSRRKRLFKAFLVGWGLYYIWRKFKLWRLTRPMEMMKVRVEQVPTLPSFLSLLDRKPRPRPLHRIHSIYFTRLFKSSFSFSNLASSRFFYKRRFAWYDPLSWFTVFFSSFFRLLTPRTHYISADSTSKTSAFWYFLRYIKRKISRYGLIAIFVWGTVHLYWRLFSSSSATSWISPLNWIGAQNSDNNRPIPNQITSVVTSPLAWTLSKLIKNGKYDQPLYPGFKIEQWRLSDGVVPTIAQSHPMSSPAFPAAQINRKANGRKEEALMKDLDLTQSSAMGDVGITNPTLSLDEVPLSLLNNQTSSAYCKRDSQSISGNDSCLSVLASINSPLVSGNESSKSTTENASEPGSPGSLGSLDRTQHRHPVAATPGRFRPKANRSLLVPRHQRRSSSLMNLTRLMETQGLNFQRKPSMSDLASEAALGNASIPLSSYPLRPSSSFKHLLETFRGKSPRDNKQRQQDSVSSSFSSSSFDQLDPNLHESQADESDLSEDIDLEEDQEERLALAGQLALLKDAFDFENNRPRTVREYEDLMLQRMQKRVEAARRRLERRTKRIERQKAQEAMQAKSSSPTSSLSSSFDFNTDQKSSVRNVSGLKSTTRSDPSDSVRLIDEQNDQATSNTENIDSKQSHAEVRNKEVSCIEPGVWYTMRISNTNHFGGTSWDPNSHDLYGKLFAVLKSIQ